MAPSLAIGIPVYPNYYEKHNGSIWKHYLGTPVFILNPQDKKGSNRVKMAILDSLCLPKAA